MSAWLWLPVAALPFVPLAVRCTRRALGMALCGRSHDWPLRITPRGAIRSRGFRLRLYGVTDAFDVAANAARLRSLVDGASLRWRVLAVDRDGTLAVVLRANRRNVAFMLLREGLIGVRGTGARRLRQAESLARQTRRGLWRSVDFWPRACVVSSPARPLPFAWWQG